MTAARGSLLSSCMQVRSRRRDLEGPDHLHLPPCHPAALLNTAASHWPPLRGGPVRRLPGASQSLPCVPLSSSLWYLHHLWTPASLWGGAQSLSSSARDPPPAGIKESDGTAVTRKGPYQCWPCPESHGPDSAPDRGERTKAGLCHKLMGWDCRALTGGRRGGYVRGFESVKQRDSQSCSWRWRISARGGAEARGPVGRERGGVISGVTRLIRNSSYLSLRRRERCQPSLLNTES